MIHSWKHTYISFILMNLKLVNYFLVFTNFHIYKIRMWFLES
jgi:hypothetical protein